MYSNSTFLTPSTCNSCLYVLNNRLPRLARYLQAVFIVSNFLEDLINLNLKLELERSSRCCGLALSHGLVLHVGLTSLHLSPFDRIVQGKKWL